MIESDEISPFWEHIEALQRVTIKAFVVIAVGVVLSLFFYQEIFSFLLLPLNEIYFSDTLKANLLILGPLEGMAITLKMCFWTSLVATSPIWLFFLLSFISPALRSSEKGLLLPFVIASFLFLSFGAIFGFFITIPMSNQYLLAFNSSIGNNMWTLSNYFDYTLMLIFASALAFELAVVLFFLVHFGIFSHQAMIEKRRLAIVVAFVLGAVLTPPDILTQLMLALPLIALYEAAIWYAYIRERIRGRSQNQQPDQC